jgi:hypothetical protein
MRLNNGLIDNKGDKYTPRIVRVGVRSRVLEEVSHLYIDYLVKQEIKKKVDMIVQEADVSK